jgi:hypothetical protein
MFHVPRAASHPRPLSPKKGVRGLELELGHVPSSNPSSASYTVNTPFGSSYTPENPDFFANYSVQPPRRPPLQGDRRLVLQNYYKAETLCSPPKRRKRVLFWSHNKTNLASPHLTGILDEKGILR